MNNKVLSSIIPFILFSNVNSPFKQSYTISLPETVYLNDTGSFLINVESANLNDNDTINVDFAESFILKDTHGKTAINGLITNPHLQFSLSNESQNLFYTLDNTNLGAGQWLGLIKVNISLVEHAPSNMLISGNELNNILKVCRPTNITFSHSTINGVYDYDLSAAKDESILLYMQGDDAIITNMSDDLILANNDMSNAFKSITSIETINNIDYIDFSTCTNTSGMFYENKYVKNIPGINNIDMSNVIDTSKMFYSCQSLTSLNLSNWNTSSLIDMNSMFYNCAKLAITGLEYFDVSKVKDMSNLFNACSTLNSLSINNWNTSNVEDMSYMFKNCKKLASLDLTNWDVSKVKNMCAMFQKVEIPTSLGNFSNWDTSNVEDMSYMFHSCANIQNLSLTNFATDKVNNMQYMFYNMKNVESIGDISNWNVSNVTSFFHFIDNAYKLRDFGDVSKWRVSNKCTNLAYMFNSSCYTKLVNGSSCFIEELDLSNWDTSNVTTTSHMFANAFNLKKINLSNWVTSNITDMSSMFEMTDSNERSKLVTIIGLNGFDVSNVTNMSKMFSDCMMFVDVDSFTNWNTAKLANVSSMFYRNYYVDLRQFANWNVSSITNKTNCFGMQAGIYASGSYVVPWA